MMDDKLSTRIWNKIQKGEPHECWPWQGALSSGRYPAIKVGGRRGQMLRVSRLLTAAQPGQVAMHSCDFPLCCNPAHLRVGTQRENMRDCAEKQRNNGKLHPLSVIHIRLSNLTQTRLANHYSVSQSKISKARLGQNYSWIPC